MPGIGAAGDRVQLNSQALASRIDGRLAGKLAKGCASNMEQ